MAKNEQSRVAMDGEREFRDALGDVLTAAGTLAASRDRRVFEAIERVESACARVRIPLRTPDENVPAP